MKIKFKRSHKVMFILSVIKKTQFIKLVDRRNIIALEVYYSIHF